MGSRAKPLQPASRFYFLCGQKETPDSDLLPKSQQQIVETLGTNGFKKDTDVKSIVCPDGQHAEWFWRREFPAAYQWLFAAVAVSTDQTKAN